MIIVAQFCVIVIIWTASSVQSDVLMAQQRYYNE
jgi:hypothetical protein